MRAARCTAALVTSVAVAACGGGSGSGGAAADPVAPDSTQPLGLSILNATLVAEQAVQHADVTLASAHLALSFDTTVDPKSFPIVLLAAGTPVRPAGFEFTVRSALAQLGLTRVYNVGEFRRLAHDLRFAGADDTVNAALVRRFSQEIAPVLVVEATNIPFGEARMRFDLRVIDGRDAKILLNVNHPRFIWVDHDAEVLRPVLNQLRRWARASAKRAA
ncbi:MAG TPA: hypothetical protein VM491_23350 [Burkholderiaceae bacterium]|nr:hypothetical protein [Burkholderiaceae bacterium]